MNLQDEFALGDKADLFDFVVYSIANRDYSDRVQELMPQPDSEPETTEEIQRCFMEARIAAITAGIWPVK